MKGFKKAHKKYQDLFEDEKNKKQQNGCERFKNLPEDEKQKLTEYRKKYYKI